MSCNLLNPNWLLSRALEWCGVDTYLKRTEFAAHFFAGCTFALLGWVTMLLWTLWTLADEFYFDGWKGSDTIVDLISKLAGSLGYVLWIVFR